MENVRGDGFEILHQVDVLSAEPQEHQGSVRQDGQLQSASVSGRGSAKTRSAKNKSSSDLDRYGARKVGHRLRVLTSCDKNSRNLGPHGLS